MPGERRKPHIGTIEEYRKAFGEVLPKATVAQRRMLEGHARVQSASMQDIVKFAGYSSYTSGNSHYGALAKMITEMIGLSPKGSFIKVLADFPGKNLNGEAVLRVHDEVIAALDTDVTQVTTLRTGDDPVQAEALKMAETAYRTAAAANGQEVTSRAKIKDFEFASRQDAADHIRELLETQRHRCALTNLPLQFHADFTDPAMLCSLDRIDSSGHYEKGNLQVVCRFANQWKSSGSDAEFRRLIALLRSTT